MRFARLASIALFALVARLSSMTAVVARFALLTKIASRGPVAVAFRAGLKAAQPLTQRFDVAFVRRLFPFGLLQNFQDALHLFERHFQITDDAFHIADGVGDGGAGRFLSACSRSVVAALRFVSFRSSMLALISRIAMFP